MIQFSSNTNTGVSTRVHKLSEPLLHVPPSSPRVAILTDWLYTRGVLTTPSVSIIHQNDVPNSERHFTYYDQCIAKAIIKNTNEQSDKKACKMRSGRALEYISFCPMEVGCITLPVHGCINQSRGSLNPIVYRV